MKISSPFFLTLILAYLPFACGSGEMNILPPPITQISQEFSEYWFKGLAEVNSYRLEQARYGEMRSGNAVLIFVTEPFSINKHVKLDHPDAADDDKIDVLKLNFTRKFETGIYPYSLMTSVFTPIHNESYRHALKINTSCQEWCGHTFTQLDSRDGGHVWNQYSYFESDGNTEKILATTIMEDELWTTLRTCPECIPTGEMNVLPSTQYLRFTHEPPIAVEATISWMEEGDERILKVLYKASGRKLEIRSARAFPYTIDSWTEEYKDGWGEKAKVLVTKGTLIKRLRTDYWNQNANADSTLYQELGLK